MLWAEGWRGLSSHGLGGSPVFFHLKGRMVVALRTLTVSSQAVSREAHVNIHGGQNAVGSQGLQRVGLGCLGKYPRSLWGSGSGEGDRPDWENQWGVHSRTPGPEVTKGASGGVQGVLKQVWDSRIWLTWPEPPGGVTGRKTRQEVHSFTTHQPQDTHTKLSRKGYMKMASSTV